MIQHPMSNDKHKPKQQRIFLRRLRIGHRWGVRYRSPCRCENRERKRARVLKERPAKDVQAAKARQFKDKLTDL